jgi:hypothetical protein
MNLSLGTLGLSVNGNVTHFFVTYTNILTSLTPPHVVTVMLTVRERSSTACNKLHTHSFGGLLEPRSYFSAKTLDQ